MTATNPIIGKNPIVTDGVDYVFVEVPVISTDPRRVTTHFTASLQDVETITQHRWRVLGTTVVTLVDTKTVPFTSLILGMSSEDVPHQVDGNPLNFSRDNLKYGMKDKVNEVLVNGEYAYITLPDAQVVVIDSVDVERVSPHFWKVYRVRGDDVVRTHYKVNGKWKKTDLSRFILNYSGRKSVVNLNGDILDNRRRNLRINPL